jgi:hypothetical protein
MCENERIRITGSSLRSGSPLQKKDDGVGGVARPIVRVSSLLPVRLYEQVEATIVTVSTFSFGALALDEDAVLGLPLGLGAVAELLAAADSSVPLIVTLWPTCGVSLLSSPSSRYVAAAELLGLADAPAAGAADPDVPVAAAAEPVPRIAFARMNPPAAPAGDAVPDVPVAVACSAR